MKLKTLKQLRTLSVSEALVNDPVLKELKKDNDQLLIVGPFKAVSKDIKIPKREK